ncbi:polysaccharide deacetylase family protein [Acidaminobacter hydrogenoformans]|uniref:DUF3298 domain-containing protein n=1 Tax=Acidaminobacter hydrogenoformans DSM 2784 TaxID=1120920 RepID=A0A1G5S891_9FIRM|nr:hypothetical protein [Acidaminobacter hydrogenoformans]SCZ81941.1 hypothetical protein SAMN03080599_03189 [Acidaminobacter hydrogenoformans DSM 2784]
MDSKKVMRILGMILTAALFFGGCAAQNNKVTNPGEGAAEGPAGVTEDQAATDAAVTGTAEGSEELSVEPAETEGVQGLMAAGAESEGEGIAGLVEGKPQPRLAQSTQEMRYGVKEAWIRSESAEVRYPVIEGLENLELQDEMNKAIYSAIDGYVVSANGDGDQVTLDYEITRMDDKILSVVITGLQPHLKSTYDVMFSVNLDANTSKEIKASNLFLSDEASRAALTALICEADTSFDSDFGPWLGIYFEGENLNFFYLENDKAAVYNVISLPLEAVIPYFKMVPWSEEVEPEAAETPQS